MRAGALNPVPISRPVARCRSLYYLDYNNMGCSHAPDTDDIRRNRTDFHRENRIGSHGLVVAWVLTSTCEFNKALHRTRLRLAGELLFVEWL